jgi:hypothetical protein
MEGQRESPCLPACSRLPGWKPARRRRRSHPEQGAEPGGIAVQLSVVKGLREPRDVIGRGAVLP